MIDYQGFLMVEILSGSLMISRKIMVMKLVTIKITILIRTHFKDMFSGA